MANSLLKKVEGGTKATLQNQTPVKMYPVQGQTPKKGPGHDFKKSLKGQQLIDKSGSNGALHGYA